MKRERLSSHSSHVFATSRIKGPARCVVTSVPHSSGCLHTVSLPEPISSAEGCVSSFPFLKCFFLKSLTWQEMEDYINACCEACKFPDSLCDTWCLQLSTYFPLENFFPYSGIESVHQMQLPVILRTSYMLPHTCSLSPKYPFPMPPPDSKHQPQ